MNIYQLPAIFPAETLSQFHKWLSSCEWYHGAPGGFVTNYPNRGVNAFGDGAGVNESGELSSVGWDKTFWTAKMNQSNVTLETPTEPLPQEIRNLIPRLRELFLEIYPDATITNHTFTIAVCNYYTDPTMNICAHSDANAWYPVESCDGPVFASFTFYPEGEPTSDNAFARFQIKQDDKWIPIKLPHNSVMIMPSNIEHRVLAHTKRQQPHFKPRINITLRSTYTMDKNPLMNAMATANHARYYKIPNRIHIPSDLDKDITNEIVRIYNNFAIKYGRNELERLDTGLVKDRRLEKKHQMSRYRQLSDSCGFSHCRGATNIVTETLKMVIAVLVPQRPPRVSRPGTPTSPSGQPSLSLAPLA
jgi:hypothetical protein